MKIMRSSNNPAENKGTSLADGQMKVKEQSVWLIKGGAGERRKSEGERLSAAVDSPVRRLASVTSSES
ncbi:hypothetical protein J6590_015622 [Homalodisca vitripennis]|nr:hypothetical protein J6590_015622 [Homalodisca vitripennis]